MGEDQPLLLAILADVADAAAMNGVGDAGDTLGPACDLDLAFGRRIEAQNAFGELRPARDDEGVEADDLALAHGKIDVCMAERGGDVFQGQHRLRAAVIAWRPIRYLLVSADHQAHKVLAPETRQRPARTGITAIAQYRHFVADLLHFLELVADEQKARALVSELPQQAKQNLGLLRRQRGRGFVEKQDARAQRKRLGDLDKVHLRDVELQDRRARVEIELENLQPAARLGMDGVVIDRAHGSAAQAFEQYVFAHREARNEIALLMDDADAGGDRVTRTLEADGRAMEPQLAIVRMIDARDNLDQRRFAGAVFAEQRVDRAAAHRQRYVL